MERGRARDDAAHRLGPLVALAVGEVAAHVENVEHRQALDGALVGRPDETCVEAATGLALQSVEHLAQMADVGHLFHVARLLFLVGASQLVVAQGAALGRVILRRLLLRLPGQSVDRARVAENHRQVFDAVGHVDPVLGQRPVRQPVEEGDASDADAVEGHAPAQAVAADGVEMPAPAVEAQVVARRVDA